MGSQRSSTARIDVQTGRNALSGLYSDENACPYRSCARQLSYSRCSSLEMVANKLVKRLLEQIRTSLQLVVEPRLRDIDSKLDHIIENQREARDTDPFYGWRRYE